MHHFHPPETVRAADSPTSPERTLYKFIEDSAEMLTRTMLGGAYRKVTFLKGSAATLASFVSALGTAAGPNTEAVDVILTTHGNTNLVVFADGAKSTED